MNCEKTGNFIAERRKAKGLTQSKLAEMLEVSEKTISKWECGNGFPDTSLILPLCNALEISANELLSAELLTKENYKQNAEENLLYLQAEQEKKTKLLLVLEWVIGFGASIFFITMCFVAGFLVNSLAWKIILIIFSVIIFAVGLFFALIIEKDAGFYECQNCKHRYVPSFKSVVFSMHIGRTRYLKCPKCNKKTWNKKQINANNCEHNTKNCDAKN